MAPGRSLAARAHSAAVLKSQIFSYSSRARRGSPAARAARAASAQRPAARCAAISFSASRFIDQCRRKWYTARRMMQQERTIGVIGGSGLYELEGLTGIER